MVVRCTTCQTAYRLDATRVPDAGVRVRCPRCGHVFTLRPAPAAMPAAPQRPAAAAPASREGLAGFEVDHRSPPRLRPKVPGRPAEGSGPPPLAPRHAWTAEPERTVDFGSAPPKPVPRLETPPFRPTPEAAPAGRTTATPVPASPAVAPAGPAHERARRLARVLVSDILVYNQAVRDRARGEGNLASALGPEIAKAWELYKSKVSPEVVASTTYFKDALNEILAGGDKIF